MGSPIKGERECDLGYVTRQAALWRHIQRIAINEPWKQKAERMADRYERRLNEMSHPTQNT